MKYNKYIDHTNLAQDATKADIKKLCDEAKQYDFASVMVNACWVKFCADELKGTDVKPCTVIGFPLGATTTATKVFEAKEAVENGAQEVDMVINVGEIIRACELSVEAGADFVKTSTGFSKGGATVHAVELMKKTVGDRCQVKASGGIHTHVEMMAMIEAGATRIGASAGVKLMAE